MSYKRILYVIAGIVIVVSATTWMLAEFGDDHSSPKVTTVR